MTLTQLSASTLHWVFLPCANIWETEHMLVFSRSHASSPLPPQTHLSSSKRFIHHPSIYLCHISCVCIFMSQSDHHPPIHLIIFLCHPSSPLSLHVPSNYRVQNHSFERLSISSICPDSSLKIKKIALDQSK